ncbi:sulfite exporter TauE/SafE family protein [Amnibacterium sp. CER49]|uniref:sulfite exporter TauE/SafE family protein n=1 Tax=Amnibacterium sp. CER49 TaxID=3039161 RepID=UPI00244C831E|nr:sulfite exporter TauE/SafE family protein [Amnibacterium sp. CER49]MDH2444010.1 sulfite exporter TauE/SafE family protein [Amnibacterium sp. CER49]
MPDGAPAAGRPLPLVLTGLVGGLLSGLFGVGGGVLMVPLLTLWARLGQRRAVATSLAALVLSSAAGCLSYLARGAVDVPAAAALIVGSVVGAVIGSALLRRLPVPVLRWAFLALLVAVAVRLLLAVPVGRPAPLTPLLLVVLVAVGLAVGIASGLFGVGGGVLIVPALGLLFGLPELVAKGTSLLVIVPAGFTGTLRNRRAGLVDLRAAALVGAPAAVASIGGSALAFLLPASLSRVLFAILLLAVSAQLAVRAVRASRRR